MPNDPVSDAHFLLPTIGSAGDVYPFVGLGLALRRRGHRVTVVTGEYFEPLIRRVGLEFASLGSADEYLRMIKEPDLWHPQRGTMFVLREGIANMIRPVYDAIVGLRTTERTVVAASTLALGARVAQERHRIPTATIHLQPSILRSIVRPPILPGMFTQSWLPRWYIRAQFWLADKLVVDRLVCPQLNSLRRELGLQPVARPFDRYLHSPQLVLGMFPEWFAPPAPDWPPNVHLPGFPLYDEQDVTPLDAELVDFLNSGEPPIAFTPGSAMMFGEKFFAAAVDACQRLGCHGLLLTRHTEQLPMPLPLGVRHVAFAPLSQLLPHCAALVHHGGIGTMSQALAAGVPQVVMPMAHDQPDNAARAEQLRTSATLRPKHFRRLASGSS